MPFIRPQQVQFWTEEDLERSYLKISSTILYRIEKQISDPWYPDESRSFDLLKEIDSLANRSISETGRDWIIEEIYNTIHVAGWICTLDEDNILYIKRPPHAYNNIVIGK